MTRMACEQRGLAHRSGGASSLSAPSFSCRISAAPSGLPKDHFLKATNVALRICRQCGWFCALVLALRRATVECAPSAPALRTNDFGDYVTSALEAHIENTFSKHVLRLSLRMPSFWSTPLRGFAAKLKLQVAFNARGVSGTATATHSSIHRLFRRWCVAATCMGRSRRLPSSIRGGVRRSDQGQLCLHGPCSAWQVA